MTPHNKNMKKVAVNAIFRSFNRSIRAWLEDTCLSKYSEFNLASQITGPADLITA